MTRVLVVTFVLAAGCKDIVDLTPADASFDAATPPVDARSAPPDGHADASAGPDGDAALPVDAAFDDIDAAIEPPSDAASDPPIDAR